MFKPVGLQWRIVDRGDYRGIPIAVQRRSVSWGVVWDAYTPMGNVLFCYGRDAAIKAAIAEIKRGR